MLEVSDILPSCIMLPPLVQRPKIGTKFLALYTRSYRISFTITTKNSKANFVTLSHWWVQMSVKKI